MSNKIREVSFDELKAIVQTWLTAMASYSLYNTMQQNVLGVE